jgi:hypothetical protein
MSDQINNPAHYGGEDNVYEAIKVIEAWGLDNSFCLGNVLKYLSRCGKKEGNSREQDLKKALWYLSREINKPMKPEHEQELLESVQEVVSKLRPSFDDLLKAKRVKLVETNATRSYLAYNDVGAAFKVSHWETTKDTLSLIPEITSDFSMWISREHFQDGKLTMTDSDIYWKWEIIE